MKWFNNFRNAKYALIAVAAVIYMLSVLVSLKDRRHRKKFLLFHGVALLVLIAVLFVFRSNLQRLFTELVDRGLKPRMRDVIYPEGIRTFLDSLK